MKNTFDLDEEQAFALLRFLYDVRPSEIAQFREGIEWAVFDKACAELRMALRDGIEPGWRDEPETL